MRLNTRLLGQALGLARPSTCPLSLRARINHNVISPSLTHRRRYTSPPSSWDPYGDDDPPYDPILDRPAKEVEHEQTLSKFRDESTIFPGIDFTPSLALQGERDHFFPPGISSPTPPTPRTTLWPGSSTASLAQTVRQEAKIPQYRQTYSAFVAIEKRILAKAYSQEDIVRGSGEVAPAERVRQDQLRKAEEEERTVELLRRSPVTNELIPGRLLAAVPWTTARFRISNALIADAFVELTGVDITSTPPGDKGEEREEVTETTLKGLQKRKEKREEEDKKLAKSKGSKKFMEEKAKKLAMKRKKEDHLAKASAIKKEIKHQSWLSLVFAGVPAEEVRFEDWNAAIRYYKDLECEIRESHAAEFRRNYRKRNQMGTAESHALRGIAEPGDSYTLRERERGEPPEAFSLDRFLEEEGGEEKKVVEGGEESRRVV